MGFVSCISYILSLVSTKAQLGCSMPLFLLSCSVCCFPTITVRLSSRTSPSLARLSNIFQITKRSRTWLPRECSLLLLGQAKTQVGQGGIPMIIEQQISDNKFNEAASFCRQGGITDTFSPNTFFNYLFWFWFVLGLFASVRS